MRLLLLLIFFTIIACNSKDQKALELTTSYIKQGNITQAENYISKIQSQDLKTQKDSLQAIIDSLKREKSINDSIALLNRKKEQYRNLQVEYLTSVDFLKKQDFTDYHNTPQGLLDEINMFSRKAQLVKNANKHDSLEIKNLGEEVKKYLTRAQISEFPKLRKYYAEFAYNKLWEEDIEVRSSGSGNKTITFIGGTFAANKNKKDWQESFASVFERLRFHRVFYKWNQYDNGVFYELDPYLDSYLDITTN